MAKRCDACRDWKNARSETRFAALCCHAEAHDPKAALAPEFGISRTNLYDYPRTGE
ncbi:hypothetical protein PRJ_5669 (plasmid) [Pseudomonas sp. XWY-1]|uniref:hypothetical protein n=1 Tax=Pseudomonas putida TaxID=303 RepID=UPI000A8FEC95|nr:hypothetical protein [Pseudomonas putida]AUZ62227.1 hypothetical protein PRJ_5669 [Pseudomonas sp. XWY-1]QUG92804.1 hypothetical protein GR140_29045 [Pseudomonas putida]